MHQKVLSFLPWVQIVSSGQSLPFFANGVFGHSHCFFSYTPNTIIVPSATSKFKFKFKFNTTNIVKKFNATTRSNQLEYPGIKIPITLGQVFYYNKIKMIIFLIMYGSDWSVISITMMSYQVIILIIVQTSKYPLS